MAARYPALGAPDVQVGSLQTFGPSPARSREKRVPVPPAAWCHGRGVVSVQNAAVPVSPIRGEDSRPVPGVRGAVDSIGVALVVPVRAGPPFGAGGVEVASAAEGDSEAEAVSVVGVEAAFEVVVVGSVVRDFLATTSLVSWTFTLPKWLV